MAIAGALLASSFLASSHANALPKSPKGKVLVLNANLRESHPEWNDDIKGFPTGDLEYSGELRNFARYWKRRLNNAPDVLLLQELIAPSARRTARILSNRFGRRYVVVIAPGNRQVVGSPTGNVTHKRNTAILINRATMKVVRAPGFLRVSQWKGEQRAGIKRLSHDLAYALLKERASGLKVSVMSNHWVPAKNFRSREVSTRAKVRWARRTARFLREKYPRAKVRMTSGEFNNRRCPRNPETVECDETPFWRTFTSDRFDYKDAVYVKHRSSNRDLRRQATSRGGIFKRIDYIFAQPAIFRATRSVDYHAERLTRGFISDHKSDMAMVGLRKSSISLHIDKTRNRINVSGRVTPNHSGMSVRVDFRKRRSRFVQLGSSTPTLGKRSRYTSSFGRPRRGTCRINVRFRGDRDHLPSSKRKTFNC